MMIVPYILSGPAGGNKTQKPGQKRSGFIAYGACAIRVLKSQTARQTIAQYFHTGK